MSGKLDQSLDEIMKDRKPVAGAPATGRRGRNGRLPGRKAAIKSKAATTAIIAPVGGVQKKTKAGKPARAPVAISVPAAGDSKISVSNLPEDVTEALIKYMHTDRVDVEMAYAKGVRTRNIDSQHPRLSSAKASS